MSLLEIRLFTLHPGTREEFDRLSREETVPLMRRYGITVLTGGPTLNDEDGYCLVRAFASEEERIGLQKRFYAGPEWAAYDKPVTEMIADYKTVVLPLTPELRRRFGA
ncbi:NIPSNAP family protein [Streptomyces sp. NPDC018045]|uniref:NIPSNAP family protein n=1 Tax=Streptomyces sp. NPDC018045 TaxID=3365037 RepID=UPI003787C7CD